MSFLVIGGTTCAAITEVQRCQYQRWQIVASTLIRADESLATGAISVVEHEALWWQAYDLLAPAEPEATR
jgi:hypothetical protein